MSDPTKANTLKVSGATLYYEVRGSGPLLLMIPGGPMDAGAFSGLAERLADRYTVVAYDPRGNSRSIFDGAPQDQQLDVHGDDAARLIEALGDDLAYVFGSSSGAMIGLNLTARHPARVRTLVAHEPPCVRLLPDPSEALAGMQQVYDIYRAQGVGPAMQKFAAITGLSAPQDGPPQVEPTAETKAMFARVGGNMDYFLGHGIKPVSSYLPDIEALRDGPAWVVVGVGNESRGQLAHRSALALADALGTTPVIFPGDHGFAAHTASVAEILDGILKGA